MTSLYAYQKPPLHPQCGFKAFILQEMASQYLEGSDSHMTHMTAATSVHFVLYFWPSWSLHGALLYHAHLAWSKKSSLGFLQVATFTLSLPLFLFFWDQDDVWGCHQDRTLYSLLALPPPAGILLAGPSSPPFSLSSSGLPPTPNTLY